MINDRPGDAVHETTTGGNRSDDTQPTGVSYNYTQTPPTTIDNSVFQWRTKLYGQLPSIYFYMRFFFYLNLII